MLNESTVDPRHCPAHGLTKVQRGATLTTTRDTTAQPLTWWECPQCVVRINVPSAPDGGEGRC